MAKRRSIVIAFICAAFLIGLNIPVPTRQGVNYKVRVYKIPLYIKMIEFISRDYRYAQLSGEITSGKGSDKEKVMAILEWVRANIKTDFPSEWPIYDNHILNIIIRGYGASDQIADVFTTLCAYSGLPAGWARIILPDQEKSLVLSLVKMDGKWRVFDVFRYTWFINDTGDIASTDDILSDRYKNDAQRPGEAGFAYKEYFKYMEAYIKDITLSLTKQMPFHRALYEAATLFNPDRNGASRYQGND